MAETKHSQNIEELITLVAFLQVEAASVAANYRRTQTTNDPGPAERLRRTNLYIAAQELTMDLRRFRERVARA